jgi:hypothetical protein
MHHVCVCPLSAEPADWANFVHRTLLYEGKALKTTTKKEETVGRKQVCSGPSALTHSVYAVMMFELCMYADIYMPFVICAVVIAS